MQNEEFRTCKICGDDLHVIEFRHKKHRSDGRHLICIDCETEVDPETEVKEAMKSLKESDEKRQAVVPRKKRKKSENIETLLPDRDDKGRFLPPDLVDEKDRERAIEILGFVALCQEGILEQLTELYNLLSTRVSVAGRKIDAIQARVASDQKHIKNFYLRVNNDEQ